MWKIIKTELSYIRWLILPTVLIIVSIILYDKRYVFKLHSIFIVGTFLIPYIVHSCAIISYVLLYLEIRENRLRQFALLPISRTRLGIARILSPFALLGIFFILAVMNDPRMLGDLVEFWLFKGLTIHGGYRWYSSLPYAGHPPTIAIMFFCVLIARLVTEPYGRLLLLIGAMLSIVTSVIIPIFNRELGYEIGDYIYETVIVGSMGGAHDVTLANIVFVAVIFFSFTMRKSFTTI